MLIRKTFDFLIITHLNIFSYNSKMEVKINMKVDDLVEKLSKGYESHVRTGLLVGEIKDDVAYVNDVYVIGQESSEAGSYFKNKDIDYAMNDIKSQGKEVLGLAKYNHKFAVFQSNKTLEDKKAIGKDLAVIVNSRKQMQVYK